MQVNAFLYATKEYSPRNIYKGNDGSKDVESGFDRNKKEDLL